MCSPPSSIFMRSELCLNSKMRLSGAATEVRRSISTLLEHHALQCSTTATLSGVGRLCSCLAGPERLALRFAF